MESNPLTLREKQNELANEDLPTTAEDVDIEWHEREREGETMDVVIATWESSDGEEWGFEDVWTENSPFSKQDLEQFVGDEVSKKVCNHFVDYQTAVEAIQDDLAPDSRE